MSYQTQKLSLKEKLKAIRTKFLKPPTDQPLSEWAEENMILGRDSALPGKFSFDRAEFQREPFDAASDPTVQRLVISAGSQTMKTQILLAYTAYMMAEDPGPCLTVNSTGSLTETYSKARLAPMLETVPVLRGLVNPSRQRDSENTIKFKSFPGGFIKLGTAGSVTDLSSLAIRTLLMDECSRYEHTKEGSSIELAAKRTTTFADRKIILVSSPSEEGNCQITDEFETTDQRYFHVPCYDCGALQKLEWQQVKWAEERPETAHYVCGHCDAHWNEPQKNEAVRHGIWIAEHPENETRGYSISGLYSSFVSLPELAIEFLNAKRAAGTDSLQVFVNTRLAQTWKNQSHTVAGINFDERLEDYDVDSIPNEVVLITAGCDVQKNSIVMSVWGWAAVGDESYLLEHIVFNGSPDTPEVWDEVKQYFAMKYQRRDGIRMPIHSFCIDSGGLSTQAVYKFCTRWYKRRVYAIKGAAGSKPLFPINASKTKYGGKVWIVGVDTGKALWYQQLTVDKPGAGYVHFPTVMEDHPQFFEEIVSEKWRPKYKSGRMTKEWFAVEGKPTEALDCRVYASCALASTKINLESRGKRLAKKAEEIQEIVEKDDISVEKASVKLNTVKKKKRTNKRKSQWGDKFK